MHPPGTHPARGSTPAIASSLVNALRLVSLLATVAGCAWIGSSAAARFAQLDPRPLVQSSGDRDAAYLVLRPRDCESAVSMLRLFDRAPIARRVALLGVLLVESSAREADSLRRVVHGLRPGLALRVATRTERRTLGALGLRRAPFLVLLEARSGAVRFATALPRDADQQVALARALGGVVDAH